MSLNIKGVNIIDLIGNRKFPNRGELLQWLFNTYLRNHNQKIFTHTELREKILEYHNTICNQCREDGVKEIVFVVIMHGAKPFADELITEIKQTLPDLSIKIQLLRCSSYGDEAYSSKSVELEYISPINPIILFNNKTKVIIIEDIVEKGKTIKYLVEDELSKFDIDLCGIYILIDKTKGKDLGLNSRFDFVIEKGLVYNGRLFLYGFGPDLLKYLRDLPCVWGIEEELFYLIKKQIEKIFPDTEACN